MNQDKLLRAEEFATEFGTTTEELFARLGEGGEWLEYDLASVAVLLAKAYSRMPLDDLLPEQEGA